MIFGKQLVCFLVLRQRNLNTCEIILRYSVPILCAGACPANYYRQVGFDNLRFAQLRLRQFRCYFINTLLHFVIEKKPRTVEKHYFNHALVLGDAFLVENIIL